MSVRLALQFNFRCVCVCVTCTWVQCLWRKEKAGITSSCELLDKDAGHVGCKSSICFKLQTRHRLGSGDADNQGEDLRHSRLVSSTWPQCTLSLHWLCFESLCCVSAGQVFWFLLANHQKVLGTLMPWTLTWDLLEWPILPETCCCTAREEEGRGGHDKPGAQVGGLWSHTR